MELIATTTRSHGWDGDRRFEEADAIQVKFLDRFMIAVRAGRLLRLVAMRSNLQLISIPPQLIMPRVLLFDRDELHGIANTTVTGIRVKVRPEAVRNAAPGPRAGLPTPKDRASDAVLAILNNELERPANAAAESWLAGWSRTSARVEDYKEGSIEK